MGRGKRYTIRLLRSFVIAIREFNRDNCPLKASALTFYTMLSVVPIIALLFGIARGFGLEKRLENELQADISYNQEALQYIFDLAVKLVENTSGTFVAGAGMMVLIWALMRLVGQIELSLNDIFEVKSGRSMLRKFSDYLSITLVAPVLIILTGSISVYISTSVSSVFSEQSILGVFNPVVRLFFGLSSIVTSMLLFTIIYIILPNTRVKLSAALFGAFFAAVTTSILGWVYLNFQVGVSKYNAIYGGLAALPLFLVFVNTNWLILLLGAELGHGFQRHGNYELVVDTSRISNSLRLLLSLYLVKRIVTAFENDEPSPAPSTLSEDLKIPNKLVRWGLDELCRAHLIVPVATSSSPPRYQPAVTLDRLDTYLVRSRLDEVGVDDMLLKRDPVLDRLKTALTDIEHAVKASSGNVLIRDL